MTHGAADAQRSDGRQFYRLKSGRCSQQMAVDFDEAPLVDDRRLDETVAIPLLDELTAPAPGGSRFCHLEQERPQAGRRESVGQLVYAPGGNPALTHEREGRVIGESTRRVNGRDKRMRAGSRWRAEIGQCGEPAHKRPSTYNLQGRQNRRIELPPRKSLV